MASNRIIKDDSIKFHPQETKALLSAYQSSPKYKALVDSSEVQIIVLQTIIRNDSAMISAYDKLDGAQKQLIAAQGNQIKDLQTEVKKQTRWRRFWKCTTGAVSAAFGGFVIYDGIKP